MRSLISCIFSSSYTGTLAIDCPITGHNKNRFMRHLQFLLSLNLSFVSSCLGAVMIRKFLQVASHTALRDISYSMIP